MVNEAKSERSYRTKLLKPLNLAIIRAQAVFFYHLAQADFLTIKQVIAPMKRHLHYPHEEAPDWHLNQCGASKCAAQVCARALCYKEG